MIKITTLIIAFFITTLSAQSQSLLTITPNTTQGGQTYLPTVTASGTFFQSVTPAGHIQNVYLRYGSNTIACNAPSLNVTSHTQFSVSFSIPVSPVIGQYDLVVVYEDTTTFPFPTVITLTLNHSVTIGTPNGYISGKIYEDLNESGTYELNEPALENQPVTILPQGITILTDANGIYSFGVINGSYTIQWTVNPDDYFMITTANTAYPVTINNNSFGGNDFGVVRKILYISPSFAYPGQTIQMLAVARGIFQSNINPNGNIYDAQLVNINAPVQISAQLASTQILNADSALLTFILPGVISPGQFDFFIQTGYPDSGFHYLRNAFTLLGPPSQINGQVYYDVNSNGLKDAGEPGIANREIEINPGNILLFTDEMGNYSVRLPNNSYTISLPPDILFQLTSSPSAYSVILANSVSSGNDFGITPINLQYDGFVRTSTIANCNLPGSINISFANRSNIPGASGRLYFVPSANMIYQNANPAPTTVSGDTLFWTFSNLNMFASYAVTATYQMPASGSSVTFKSFADILIGINPVYSTSDSASSIVSCSNTESEKTASPAGENIQHLTLNTSPVNYAIHFRNNTASVANNITIFDRLDQDFDFSSLVLTGSSHPVSVAIFPVTGLLVFTFTNINLPPYISNPQIADAFVSYSLVPQSNLPEGTMVYNRADIFFDNNVPLSTNNTWNTLVSQLFTEVTLPVSGNEQVTIYPNPFSESAVIKILSEANDLYRFTIYNLNGKQVLQKRIPSVTEIEKKELPAGFYFYEIVSEKRKVIYRGKLVGL